MSLDSTTQVSKEAQVKQGTAAYYNQQAALLAGNYTLTPATLANKITKGDWVAAEHLKYISARIAQAITKGGARLILCMPPRHGKSLMLSVHTPIWFLNAWPRKSIILISYGADLAEGFSKQARDYILADNDPEDGQNLLDVKLQRDSLRVNRFHTTEGGALYAVGIGGTIVGRGGDLILIDDYIKNFEEAESVAAREKTYEWYKSTARTRLEPGGSIVILATRWNITDLIGNIETDDEKAQKWEIIRLPAFAEKDDPLGRIVGAPLWEDRYNLEALQDLQTELGTYHWSAQFQQKPLSRMSGLVKDSWFPVVDILPHYSKLHSVRSWDLAATMEAGDYTAGVMVSDDTTTGLIYVSDMIRDQWGPGTLENKIKSVAENQGANVYNFIEQEPGAAGKLLVSNYSRTVLKEFMTFTERPTGPKTVRAQTFLAQAEAGNVRLLRGPWNKGFIEEFKLFPDGPHDDQVDATCAGFNFLRGKRFMPPTWGSRVRGSQGVRGTSSAPGKPSNVRVVTGATFGRRN